MIDVQIRTDDDEVATVTLLNFTDAALRLANAINDLTAKD